MSVLDHFLSFVAYDTRSDENSESVPSTEKQKILGAFLAQNLQKMGLKNAKMDDFGYVYGYLPPSNGGNLPDLGLIAHMDTSPDVSGKDVRPRIVTYNGGDIELGHGATIREKEFPNLARYVGQDLIVTDGSTLLGADDKAGVAEIFAAIEYLVAHPEVKHRGVAVCIIFDEEIGRGADHFDFSLFPAKVAYTVDGGELGEIEYENFNGAGVKLTVHGVNIHPGSAKNKMKNAVLMANQFISMLPAHETPSHTEGYEGFYHVNGIEGDESQAVVHMIIRDHDRENFEARKQFVTNLVDYLNGVWGECSFALDMKDSYYNMKEMILPHMELIDNAKAAMLAVGVDPQIIAIRGGTDGARLSYEGLPCPNLSTGGANFHSIHEFIPVRSLEKMVEVLLELLKA